MRGDEKKRNGQENYKRDIAQGENEKDEVEAKDMTSRKVMNEE